TMRNRLHRAPHLDGSAVMRSHRREAFRTRLASVDSGYWRAGDEVPAGLAAPSPVGIGAAGIKPGAAPEDETAAGSLPRSAGAGTGDPCPCAEFGLKPVAGMGDATTF